MGFIQYLDPEVYEKIAAGEIIENPSSIIQELIDNAIDAKASFIKISLEKGGKSLIQITDNGIGMSHEDLRISYHRHTTSKIKDFKDIYKSSFLGFRGEALHSIVKVAHVILRSKNASHTLGLELQIHFGNPLYEELKPLAQGTEITVSKLFEKMPVRRLQLRSDLFELNRIKDLVILKSLPFLDIEFQIFHNQKLLLHIYKARDLLERIKKIFLKDASFAENLLFLYKKNQSLSIELKGYISPVHIYEQTKKFSQIYINSRYLFESPLYKAVFQLYKKILPLKRYPIFFLFINLPPAFLDINVHPSKRNIRIVGEKEVSQWIILSIEELLKKHLTIPKASFEGRSLKSKIPFTPSKDFILKKISLEKESQENFTFKDILKKKDSINSDPNLNTDDLFESHGNTSQTVRKDHELFQNLLKEEDYKILGQLFKTYFLIEYKQSFLLIDQHALHEILNYEKLKKKIELLKKIKSQYLINPMHIKIYHFVNIDFSDENIQEKLNALGFEYEQMHKDKIILKSIPYFLKQKDIEERFKETIYGFSKNKKIPSPFEFLDNSIKMKSCRTSIKSGDPVKEEELRKIINELSEYKHSFACPHGRPIAIEIYQEDLERLFLRRK